MTRTLDRITFHQIRSDIGVTARLDVDWGTTFDYYWADPPERQHFRRVPSAAAAVRLAIVRAQRACVNSHGDPGTAARYRGQAQDLERLLAWPEPFAFEERHTVIVTQGDDERRVRMGQALTTNIPPVALPIASQFEMCDDQREAMYQALGLDPETRCRAVMACLDAAGVVGSAQRQAAHWLAVGIERSVTDALRTQVAPELPDTPRDQLVRIGYAGISLARMWAELIGLPIANEYARLAAPRPATADDGAEGMPF